ncbi:MAG: hypothetical protein R3256_12470, partial [Thalassovita sp.]|nr:hypothetical protein [Thalassovita sp.]
MTQVIENFFATWGMTDSAARDAALRDCLAEEFYYVDPSAPEPITDAAALVAYVAMFTEYAPGATARVVALSETKGHNRATVEFETADGTKQYGQYMIDLDKAGKATRMIGFVGLGAPA